MTYKWFSYYHLHQRLTLERLGSEEVRLAPLAPLPASMVQSITKTIFFCLPQKLFRNSLHNFSGSGDPDSLLVFISASGVTLV